MQFVSCVCRGQEQRSCTETVVGVMSCAEWAVELHGDVWLPTFFTGKARFLLQFQAMQVEGIAVVSKRHPCPVSQGVRALAGVGPLVDQRIIFKEKPVVGTFIW